MQILIFKILIALILIVAAAFDLKTKGERVPNYLTVMLMFTAFLNPNFNLLNSGIGFACGFAIFFLAGWLNILLCKMKKMEPAFGYGGADIKLMAGYGFAVGAWDLVLLAATIAVWVDLIYRLFAWIGSLIFKKKKEKTKVILFVPFIATGAILCLLLI